MPIKPPSRLVLPSADQCIYCGAQDDGSTEHIIPRSLGGVIELPRATCNSCKDEIRPFEARIARKTYLEQRVAHGIKVSKKKEAPTKAPIRVRHRGKVWKKILVPLDKSPIVHVVPHFKFFEGHRPSIDSKAYVEMKAVQHPDCDKRCQEIMKQHGYFQVSANTGEIKPRDFARLLWKMAYGFYWQVIGPELRATPCVEFALGSGPKLIKSAQNTKIENDGAEQQRLCYFGLFSMTRAEKGFDLHGMASVYSDEMDDHKSLLCCIRLPGALNFPDYFCAVPNVTGKPVHKLEFKPS